MKGSGSKLSEEIGLEPTADQVLVPEQKNPQKVFKTLGERDEKEALKLENEKLHHENLNLHEEEEKRLCPTCLSKDERHQYPTC